MMVVVRYSPYRGRVCNFGIKKLLLLVARLHVLVVLVCSGGEVIDMEVFVELHSKR